MGARLSAGQVQGDLQAAKRAAREFQATAVGIGDVSGDGKAEATACRAFVEAGAAPRGTGHVFVTEAAAVVFDADFDAAASFFCAVVLDMVYGAF